MLKWLRKYNTWILVIGGSLLMIAFLLPTTIEELGRTRLSGPVMRIRGSSVSVDTYSRAAIEYASLSELVGRDLFKRLGGGENPHHWVMLTHEANEGGYIGGVEDGREMIRPLADAIATASGGDPAQADRASLAIAAYLRSNVLRVAGQARMSQDDVFKALARFQGVLRMRTAYNHALRFSDRRLIAGVRDIADQAEIEYVFVPPERLITSETPAPDDAAIAAHFERYKDIRPYENDLGLGYRQHARIKAAWLIIDKKQITDGVDPDPVAIQRRIRQQFPQGLPRTEDGEAAKTRITNEVRAEQAESVVKTLDQAVRGEIERAARRLEPDDQFKKLPADWASQRPHLAKIAESAAARATELTGQRVPAPHVEVPAKWLLRSDVPVVPVLGSATLKRGTRNDPADATLFSVRELAGSNDLGLQVGLPSLEPLTNAAGDRIYFMVLEARKESPPHSLDEVRDQVVRDLNRLHAFDGLKARLEEFCSLVGSQGLEALTKPPEGATGPSADPLSISRCEVVRKELYPPNDLVNSKEFRDAVIDRALALDPTADLEKVEPSLRTFCLPARKGLGLVIARITGLLPTTIERFRRQQVGMVYRLQTGEFESGSFTDPFSQARMEQRLKVEILDKSGQNPDGEASASSDDS